ncbi:hypothetical protein J7T55_015190 [Diaporthe amygdali]|uniref:uncharacterized protein n=1 Tax=Phomopsis amygdali TaxID=1214568 RepID=UPI0022FDED25|nr:uncharacterized protein J7T55_015190 [Diaporthe amygdali]KAJ0120463.1 hypothetical protein J7T55_015190 [Diaporthe amygdali]
MPHRQPSTSKPPPVRHPSIRSEKAGPQRLSSTRSSTTRNPSVRTVTGNGPERRPTAGLRRENTLQTRYMEMLLSLDKIPRLHNILAAFFGWILLAGFIVFPGTFTSIRDLSEDPDVADKSPAASVILDQVQNVPLLVVAAVCCGIGAAGLLWLAFRWRSNYVWLLNRVYLPGATNALAGLISTLVVVYSQKHGDWSVTAKVTGIVEGADLVVCGSLFVFNTLLLKRVQRKHGREMEQFEQVGEEGLFERAGRKLQQPALEPQSVV